MENRSGSVITYIKVSSGNKLIVFKNRNAFSVVNIVVRSFFSEKDILQY